MESERCVRIGVAKSFLEIYQSFRVAHDQYCRSGYMEPDRSGLRFFLRDLLSTSYIFVAVEDGEVIGTITGILHSSAGLPCSSVFPDEIDKRIRIGRQLMEASKLACVPHDAKNMRGAKVAASIPTELLRCAFYWGMARNADDWFVVVNPTHQNFYQRKLGFTLIAEERACSHVSSAPGVLLGIDLSLVRSGENISKQTYTTFLATSIAQENIIHRHQLNEEEVVCLLLEKPDALLAATRNECQALIQEFPRTLRLLERLGRSRELTDGNRIVPMLGLTRARDAITVSEQTIQLREHLARMIEALDTPSVSNPVHCEYRVARDVPETVMVDTALFDQVVLRALGHTVQTKNELGKVTMIVSNRYFDAEQIVLHFSLIGNFEAIPDPCDDAVNRLGGQIWFSGEEQRKECLHFILPFHRAQKSFDQASEDFDENRFLPSVANTFSEQVAQIQFHS